MIDFEVAHTNRTKSSVLIKVLGIGGAGGNTLNSIVESGCNEIECIAINTDAQALELSKAKTKIQIGIKSTKGLGTGADPLIGRRAAEEDIDKVIEAIGDADIVFLTAGMGGGTGSGALPVIVKALKERGVLAVTIVTKPFEFEGKRRAKVAEDIIKQLESIVDTLIIIPNQRLLALSDPHVAMIDAFGMINTILSQSVRSISDIITRPGHINVDYADVRAIMKDRGIAVMGTGKASGPDRAGMAALQAISSPLLENMSIEGAHGVLLNITGSKTLTLHELSQAAAIVYQSAHEDANIILGTVIDESLKDEVMVTIIATGFEQTQNQKEVQKEIIMQEPQATQVIEPIHVQAALKIEHEIAKEMAAKQEQGAVKQMPEKQTIEEKLSFSLSGQDELDIPTFLRNKHAENSLN